MNFFRNRKNNKKTVSCCCKGNCNDENLTTDEKLKAEILSVKVLGSGCAKCNKLEASTKSALVKLGIDIIIDHVTDFTQIATYGVMTTPALVINEKVVSYGKVLSEDEVIKIIQKIKS